MSPILLPASSQRPVLVQLGKRKPVADLAPDSLIFLQGESPRNAQRGVERSDPRLSVPPYRTRLYCVIKVDWA